MTTSPSPKEGGASRSLKRAERLVIKAAQLLADAATELREVGHERFARQLDSASCEAASAISGALCDEDRGRP